MGTIRTVGAGAGFRWLMDAYAMARRDPGAILGAAGWMLLLLLVVTAALMLVNLFVLPGLTTSWIASAVASVLVTLPMTLVLAMGTVGYLRLLADVDAAREARASDIFRGFTDFGTVARLFGLMFAVMLFQQVVMIAIVVAFLPDVAHWYMAMAQMRTAQSPTVLPNGFWSAYVVTMLVIVATYAVQAIAVPQLVLGRRSIPHALRDGVVGILRNLPALLACLVGLMTAGLAFLIVAIVLVFLLALVSQLVSAWLAIAIAVPLYLVAMTASFAWCAAAGYAMWRDIAGFAGATPAIEA